MKKKTKLTSDKHGEHNIPRVGIRTHDPKIGDLCFDQYLQQFKHLTY